MVEERVLLSTHVRPRRRRQIACPPLGHIKDLVGEIDAGIDGRFDAMVKVLSEWVKHRVKEESADLFRKVRESDIDPDALVECLQARRDELMGERWERGGSGCPFS